jgi:hypothetical protein
MIPRHQQIPSVEVIRDVDPATQIDNIQIAEIMRSVKLIVGKESDDRSSQGSEETRIDHLSAWSRYQCRPPRERWWLGENFQHDIGWIFEVQLPLDSRSITWTTLTQSDEFRLSHHEFSMSSTSETDDIAPGVTLHRALELPEIRWATVERSESLHPPLPHFGHHCHWFSAIASVLNANFYINPYWMIRINEDGTATWAPSNDL